MITPPPIPNMPDAIPAANPITIRLKAVGCGCIGDLLNPMAPDSLLSPLYISSDAIILNLSPLPRLIPSTLPRSFHPEDSLDVACSHRPEQRLRRHRFRTGHLDSRHGVVAQHSGGHSADF